MLSAYVQMSSKAKGDVEAALSSLLDLAAAEPNNVPVLLALSHGFLLLKQAPKARNQLKRVSYGFGGKAEDSRWLGRLVKHPC